MTSPTTHSNNSFDLFITACKDGAKPLAALHFFVALEESEGNLEVEDYFVSLAYATYGTEGMNRMQALFAQLYTDTPSPKANPCPACAGTGVKPEFIRIDNGKCYSCNGTGVAVEAKYELTWGVEDIKLGSKIVTSLQYIRDSIAELHDRPEAWLEIRHEGKLINHEWFV